MKVYQLVINEVKESHTLSMLGGHQAPRERKRSEFYAKRELAEARKKTVEESLVKLMGFFPSVEILIHEIEVIE